MKLLCPACRGPLPELPAVVGATASVVSCPACQAEVDLSRASTAAGRPRYVPEPDRTGEVVGGYRVEERLGAGGMGTVYRARRVDGPAETAVAIKFLTPALAGEPEVVARFHREVALLAALDHPAIVRVLDHGDHEEVPWFAMELVPGTDLRRRLATGETLAPPEVTSVFLPLFAALGHAHDRGVIHRDLKPANVLLAAGGVKLADFGVARLAEADAGGAGAAATRLTATAAVLGTVPYMSPEQRAGRAVDRRSDLFSMGVLLYEAITGTLPQGAFPPASALNRAFPARVDTVVANLLRPAPEDRPGSAAQAAEALRRALAPAWPRRAIAAAGAGAVAALAFALTLGPSASSRQAAPKAQAAPRPAAVTTATPAQAMRLPEPPPAVQSEPPAVVDNPKLRASKGKPRPASSASAAALMKAKKQLDLPGKNRK